MYSSQQVVLALLPCGLTDAHWHKEQEVQGRHENECVHYDSIYFLRSYPRTMQGTCGFNIVLHGRASADGVC